MITAWSLEHREKKILQREKAWNKEKELIDRERKLEKLRSPYKKPVLKISTTKLIVFFIFLNCSIVEGYSMWIMYALRDISALYTLITAVVGETISFAIYAVKATKENTVGGISFESMMNTTTPLQSQNDSEDSVG